MKEDNTCLPERPGEGDIRSASPTCPSLAPCQTSCPQPSPGLLLTLLTPDSRTQLSVMEGGGQSCPQLPHSKPTKCLWMPADDRPPRRWSGGKTPCLPLPVGAQLVHTTAPRHLGFPSCLQPGTSSSGIISHPDIPCFVPELADRATRTPVHPGHPDFSLLHPRVSQGLRPELAGRLRCCPLPPGHVPGGPLRPGP